jgi:pimeloyl-ACP methyl ester carboxylesterase
MTNIDGLNIHFIHQRSKNPNARPLLLLNGWPSSPIEYTKVIGPLTDPVAYGGRVEDSFDVVVPSMPGFGFSDKPHERGYNTARVAEMWPKLMARLGYNRYFAHGSDLGGQVLNRMGINDAGAHIAALHLTGCGGGAAPAPAGATPPPAPPPTGPNGLVNAAHNAGYQEIQTTKPQTLGQGLSDSPVALASWIIEKWYGWSDHDGDMEKVFTKDELITNIMFYWVPNTGTSSARMYFEVRHAPDGRLLPSFGAGLQVPLPEGYIKVPTGCGAFPSQYDRRGTPISTDVAAARKAAEARYNVMHVAIMPEGGHYPAFEQPKLWLDDIRTFFRDRR